MHDSTYCLRSKLTDAALVRFGMYLDTCMCAHFGEKLGHLIWNGGSTTLMTRVQKIETYFTVEGR
jgi:hypothetical protein